MSSVLRYFRFIAIPSAGTFTSDIFVTPAQTAVNITTISVWVGDNVLNYVQLWVRLGDNLAPLLQINSPAANSIHYFNSNVQLEQGDVLVVITEGTAATSLKIMLRGEIEKIAA